MKYEQMSGEDINHAVLKVIHGDAVDFWTLSDCGKFLYDCGPIGEDYHQIELKDYCNNPTDAWPVIVENRIAINPYSDRDQGWFADFESEILVDDKNPLRAAMVVFLMMQEGAS